MKKLGSLLVLATSVALANSASAALIVEGGQDWTIDSKNEVNDYGLEGATGTVGGTVVSTSDQPLELTFEYLFKEAWWSNSFLVNGVAVFNTDTSAYGDTYTTTWEGGMGALDFAFTPGSLATFGNTENSADNLSNFWTQWDEATGTLLIGLDDGGNGNDDDYDDMIIRVGAVPVGPGTGEEPGAEVPEPATLALLGMGVVGLSLSRRNKKQ